MESDRNVRMIALLVLLSCAPVQAFDVTIEDDGAVVRGDDWDLSFDRQGLWAGATYKGEQVMGPGHIWLQTSEGKPRYNHEKFEPWQLDEGCAVSTTVLEDAEAGVTVTCRQTVSVPERPEYPDGVIVVDLQFEVAGARLTRVAHAFTLPLERYLGKQYFLGEPFRYPVRPLMENHTIHSTVPPCMKLLADEPSFAIVPEEFSSFQLQDNRRFGSDAYGINLYGSDVLRWLMVPPGARIAPEKLPVERPDSSRTRGDLALRAVSGWEPAYPVEPIRVPADADAPLLLPVPATLHGVRNHADLHRPLTLDVDYAEDGAFGVYLSGHSGYGGAGLIISLDGEEKLRRMFAGEPQRRLLGSAGTYVIAVPRGRHLITVDNPGADWLDIAAYHLYGYGGTPLPPMPDVPDLSGSYDLVEVIRFDGDDDPAAIALPSEVGPPVEVEGGRGRKIVRIGAGRQDPANSQFAFPVRRGGRNLLQMALCRRAPIARSISTHDSGVIRVEGRPAIIYEGEGWKVESIVIEDPPSDRVRLAVDCYGSTYIGWAAIWADGAERIPAPTPARAWNSPVDESFMRIAPSQNYFVLEDGRGFFPVGYGGGVGLKPNWGGYSPVDTPELIRAVAPYWNARKRRYWPSRTTPEPFKLVEPEMQKIHDELMEHKRLGLRWILNTTDQIQGSYPPNFTPQAEDHSHQIWWTRQVAARYRDERAIFSWACCNEPLCLKGTDEQQRAWHELISRALREEDPNHLVGADTWYYPDRAEGHLWVLGHEPTIDWVSSHPYMPLDTTLVMHKYTAAFGVPSLVNEFSTIHDQYDAYTSVPHGDHHRVDADGRWLDRFLHGILDRQAALIPWYIGLTNEQLHVCGVARRIVERMDLARFDPRPTVGVVCQPYQRITEDDMREIILKLSKDEGIAFDLVLEPGSESKYDVLVRSAEDIPRAVASREIAADVWCKYLLDREHGMGFIWVRPEGAACTVSIRGIPEGEYVVEWLDVRNGFPAKTWQGRSDGTIAAQAPGHECVGVLQPAPRGAFAVDGVTLVASGSRRGVLIGPDDVPLGMVSFAQKDHIEVYMALKELAEVARLATGAMLSVKTPAECSDEDLSRPVVIVGSPSCNSAAARVGLREGEDARPGVVWLPGDQAEDLATKVRELLRHG